MYTDQTEHFPFTLSKGSKCQMVSIELDSNCIDAEPMKSRSTQNLVEAYQVIWSHWTTTQVISPN